MPIQKTFQRTILIYFITVFLIFTTVIMLFQFNREKKYKTAQLENTLETVTDLTNNYFQHYDLIKNKNVFRADTLKLLFPEQNIRISVIDKQGNVLYDSFVNNFSEMENHLTRPEIQKALYSKTGSNIRWSNTTKQNFYYYARNYDDYFIRAAIVYNIEVKNFLKAESIYIFFIISVFLIVWLVISTLTKRLSISITTLKDFAIKAGKNDPIETNYEFPDNELGEIGSQIVKIYNNLKKAKDDIAIEKDRLFNHLNILNEGISFFSHKKEKMLANSHFIQYVSIISDTSSISTEHIFSIPEFKKINEFLDNHLSEKSEITYNEIPQIEFTINKNEKYFKILCIIFSDKSFEILITDITQPEKRRLLKQQLTSNIAHELKTPLASIKGYIETIMNNPDIDKEKHHYFIKRAHLQTERLDLLLNDISLLNNIEDAGELFEIKPVVVRNIILDVIENLKNRLTEKNISINLQISEDVIINGNDSLISSVFQNLTENTINYAGENIRIEIKNYFEDKKFHYFSYSDTGSGIQEEHLHRIFERFYRIETGRTRETGGTGLGLSIVKNAIQLHKGKVSVRNKLEGGVEFLFTISKK